MPVSAFTKVLEKAFSICELCKPDLMKDFLVASMLM